MANDVTFRKDVRKDDWIKYCTVPSEESCSICLDSNRTRVLWLGHRVDLHARGGYHPMHGDCMMKFLIGNRSPECPICREKITSINGRPIGCYNKNSFTLNAEQALDNFARSKLANGLFIAAQQGDIELLELIFAHERFQDIGVKSVLGAFKEALKLEDPQILQKMVVLFFSFSQVDGTVLNEMIKAVVEKDASLLACLLEPVAFERLSNEVIRALLYQFITANTIEHVSRIIKHPWYKELCQAILGRVFVQAARLEHLEMCELLRQSGRFEEIHPQHLGDVLFAAALLNNPDLVFFLAKSYRIKDISECDVQRALEQAEALGHHYIHDVIYRYTQGDGTLPVCHKKTTMQRVSEVFKGFKELKLSSKA